MALDLRCLVRQGGRLGLLHTQIGFGADPVGEQAGGEIAPHLFPAAGRTWPNGSKAANSGANFQDHIFLFMSRGPRWRHRARCHADPMHRVHGMKTAGSPIAAVTAPPTAALAWR